MSSSNPWLEICIACDLTKLGSNECLVSNSINSININTTYEMNEMSNDSTNEDEIEQKHI